MAEAAQEAQEAKKGQANAGAVNKGPDISQRFPSRSLQGKKVSPDILKFIPQESATYYEFVPIGIKDGTLEVGIVNPDNIEARGAVSFIADKLKMPFKVFLITRDDYEDVLESYDNLTSEVGKVLGELDAELSDEEGLPEGILSEAEGSDEAEINLVEDAPVIKIVAVIIRHATDGNASDIHIEPLADKVRVRFRVDGALHTSLFLPLKVYDAIVARIKIVSRLKLDEKRKPQDGRFSAPLSGRKIDFRVSTLPSYHGEKVAIRILDTDKGVKTIDDLGLKDDHKSIIDRTLKRPYGLVLITGPTGSGKSTTLYAMLNELDRETNNIVSLEDPIEYNIDGINQSQIRPEIGYTFANGLRSILRQDPDMIMVGEIRDKETAELAIQAALTGHMVFSTLHTNNAVGVVPRLVDMGVDPYLIAPTLVLAIGQRLVRKICPDAKEPIPVDGGVRAMIEEQFADLPPDKRATIQIPGEVYRAASSATCPGGTRGRMAVFEMLEINRDVEEVILRDPTEVAIYGVVRKNGMLSMKEDAMQKAFDGIIPFSEVSSL